MYLYQAASTWTVQAPAKLNLFFEVHGKRDDGYHEITSLAVPVRLFDTLILEPKPADKDDGALDFSCFGGGRDIPPDETNLVVRALTLLRQKTQTDRGIRVRLFKRIPSQAGLGGGSSDAAAALWAASKVWNLKLSPAELSDIGAEIGSDCPIFFQRGASLSRGRGDIIRPVPAMPRLHFVVLKPKEGLSTADVYARCMGTHDGRLRDVDELLSLLDRGSIAQIGRRFFNRLETPAEMIWPKFRANRWRLERSGCLSVRMSGSGTAFYGLCRSERHARTVAATLKQRLTDGETLFTVSGF